MILAFYVDEEGPPLVYHCESSVLIDSQASQCTHGSHSGLDGYSSVVWFVGFWLPDYPRYAHATQPIRL